MDSGIYWSMIETKEVYSKNRFSKHVYSRKNAFYGDMSICITTLALPIRRTFEYSRTNQRFDSTNLWRHMIRRIHDSASNIRIFGFDRIKMPFTDVNHLISVLSNLQHSTHGIWPIINNAK